MKAGISKYFWSLNAKALKETKNILKNTLHPQFMERAVALLSRCDKPKELFSIIPRRDFIASWPCVRKYWAKTQKASDFRDWWQTIYEQILRKRGVEERRARGMPGKLFIKIGGKIREARIRKGLSQRQLALGIGMRQPDISMIEEGRKNITLDTLMRLSKALDIKEIELEG